MAREKIASKTIVRENELPTNVVILFQDGRRVDVSLNDIPSHIQRELIAHGLSQKLGDSYAGAKGNTSAAFAECSSVAEALLKGEWNRRGTGTGGILAEAIARLTQQALEEVQAVLADMDEETKKELMKRKDVKAMIAIIRAERAKAQLNNATPDDEEDSLGSMFG